MDNKTVLSDNELIAEFMGGDVSKGWVTFQIPPSSLFHNYNWDVEDLAYNRSWDWLMPVVEKINSINGVSYIIEGNCAMEISSYGARIAFKTSDSMIDTVYKTVVEFIKYYNSTKTL